MSDDRKNEHPAGSEKARREPSAIDLPKSEVVDLTPSGAKDEPVTAWDETDKAKEEPVAARDEPAQPAEDEPAQPAEPEPAREPEPEPKQAAPVVVPPPKPRRTGALFAGLLAGGVAGAGAGYGIQTYLPATTTADPRLPALQSEVAGAGKSLTDLRAEITRLDTALKAAEERSAGGVRSLGERLTALDGKAPQLPAEAGEQLRDLAGARTALEARLKTLEAGVDGARKQAEEAVGKVEAIGKLADSAASNAGSETKVDLAPLAARIVKLEQAATETLQRTSAGDRALSTLETRLRGAEEAAAAAKTAAPAETGTALLAISALARRRAESGESLAGIVTALAGLGVSTAELKPLADFGDRPLPRLSALAAQFGEIGAKLPRATPLPEVQARESSVMDRLKANVVALVDVRPTGAARPPDQASLVAEARNRLAAGDSVGLDRALAALSPEQRTAFKPVIDAFAARAAVFAALGQIETRALQTAGRRTAGERTQ